MVGAGLEGQRACSCAVIFFVFCSRTSNLVLSGAFESTSTDALKESLGKLMMEN